jgi:hypothetical protein
MSDPNAALTLQLLEWIDERQRSYAETIEVWRTSCPRLSIWEDACLAGLVEAGENPKMVRVSARGRVLLDYQKEPVKA